MLHDVFKYPAIHSRCHLPDGYADYREYKPWLRDEFVFQCVYCLEREAWYPSRSGGFSVDHVLPQSSHQHVACDYKNLVYACVRCNSLKREIQVLDPTQTDFDKHLRMSTDGRIEGITPEGKDIVDLLHLDQSPALANRQKYLRIAQLKEEHPACKLIDELFRSAFAYPDDIPDLRRLRPPNGNSLSPSEDRCKFALKECGELPLYY